MFVYYGLFPTDKRLGDPKVPLRRLYMPYGTFLVVGEERRAADLGGAFLQKREDPRIRVEHDDERNEHFIVFPAPDGIAVQLRMFWKDGAPRSGIYLWSMDSIDLKVIEVSIAVFREWIENGWLKLRVVAI